MWMLFLYLCNKNSNQQASIMRVWHLSDLQTITETEILG